MANKAVLGVAATALAGYKLHELAKGYAVERELKKEEDERELLQEAWRERTQQQSMDDVYGDVGQAQLIEKILRCFRREVMEKLGEVAKAAHSERGTGLSLPYLGHAGADMPNLPEEVLLGVALAFGHERLINELLEDIELRPGSAVARLTPPTLRLVDNFLSDTAKTSLLPDNKPSVSAESVGEAHKLLRELCRSGDARIRPYELEGNLRDGSMRAQLDAIRSCTAALGLHAYPQHAFKASRVKPNSTHIYYKLTADWKKSWKGTEEILCVIRRAISPSQRGLSEADLPLSPPPIAV